MTPVCVTNEVLVHGGVSFQHPCTSRVDEKFRVRVAGRRGARAESVRRTFLISSVAGGIAVRLSLGDLGRALCSHSVASWLLHTELTKFK